MPEQQQKPQTRQDGIERRREKRRNLTPWGLIIGVAVAALCSVAFWQFVFP